jgi:hypothetical protein
MRLTNQKRDIVESAAINAAFHQKIDDSKKVLAKRIVKHFDDAGMVRASKIPKGFEAFINTSSTGYLCGNTATQRGIELPIAFCVKPYGSSIDIKESEWSKWTEAKNLASLVAAKKAAREDIRSVLMSCNTEKQLQEISQDLYLFYIGIMQTNKGENAIVSVDTINRVENMLRTVKG